MQNFTRVALASPHPPLLPFSINLHNVAELTNKFALDTRCAVTINTKNMYAVLVAL